MSSYWLVIFVGIVAPWIIMGGDLAKTFRSEGVREGLGQWLGMGIGCALFFLVFLWLVSFLNWAFF
jgi:hypothetical protein